MDAVLATAIFAIVFLPTIVFLNGRADATAANRVASQRMRPDEPDEPDILRRRKPESGVLGEWLSGIDIFRLLEDSMWQAGIYMRAGNVILVVVMLFGAGAAAGAYFWQDQLLSLGLALGLASLPLFYIRFLRRRRLKAFAKQLPYALDMIGSSLRAGHSLQRALQVLIAESPDPLGGEFRTVMEQTRIGLPLPRALEELLHRVPEEDLRLLVAAIRIQSQTGSSLSEIVSRLAEIVRARQRLFLQVRALTAQARMGGTLVGVLPLFVLSAFMLIEPGYATTLIYDPIGFRILRIALVCDALAFVWIKRLLKVNY